MDKLSAFEIELAALLRKYNAALISKSGKEPDDLTSELGVQFSHIHNKWFGRHHLTAYDLDNKQ